MSDIERLPAEVEALALQVLAGRVKQHLDLTKAEFSSSYNDGGQGMVRNSTGERVCSVEGCRGAHHGFGFCSKCYLRRWKRGELPKRVTWHPTPAASASPYVFGADVLPDRIWEKIQVTDSGCWEWTGAKAGGYGVTGVGPRQWRVTRLAYLVFVGELNDEMDLDHHLFPDGGCIGPACVLHTRPATSRENTLRGENFAAWNRAKTHCPQGHSYSGANLYVSKHGERRCRECARLKARARYHRKEKASS